MAVKGKKVQFRLPDALHSKMQAIAEDLGCSMNAWAIRALGNAAKNHIPFSDFINQAPARGRGKDKQSFGRLSPFNGLPVDGFGIPEGVSVADGELELHRKLGEGGEPALKRFMQTLWDAGKIEQEYTDSHLAETIRVLRAED